MRSKMDYMNDILKKASDKNGHSITQTTFDMIEGSLREIIRQYNLKPDGQLGKGFTNKPFLDGRKALNHLDEVE